MPGCLLHDGLQQRPRLRRLTGQQQQVTQPVTSHQTPGCKLPGPTGRLQRLLVAALLFVQIGQVKPRFGVGAVVTKGGLKGKPRAVGPPQLRIGPSDAPP